MRQEFTRRSITSESELQTWADLSNFFGSVDDLTDVYYDAVHYHDFRSQEIAEHVWRVLAQSKTE